MTEHNTEGIACSKCGTRNEANSKYCKYCGHTLRTGSSKDERKKKLIPIIVSMIAFSLTYYAVQKLFFKPPSFDQAMIETANEINKSCPIVVDQYTRLDNVVAMPANSFQYNYTLFNLAKEEVNLDTVKKYVNPTILNNARTSPQMKFFRDRKTTLIYYYKDKVGKFVYKLSVTPDMYR